MCIYFPDGTVVLSDSSVGRADQARRVAVRHIEYVCRGRESRAAPVAQECKRLSIGGEMQGQFGFRTEAGHNLIGRDRQGVQPMAIGRKFVQEDRRGDPEVAVGRGVVEDSGKSAVGAGNRARDGYRLRGTSSNEWYGDRDPGRTSHASRRQYRHSGHQQRWSPNIVAAGQHQGAGFEFKMIGTVIVVMVIAGLKASSQCNGYRQCKQCFLHVNFLLRLAHWGNLCGQKISRNEGALHQPSMKTQ